MDRRSRSFGLEIANREQRWVAIYDWQRADTGAERKEGTATHQQHQLSHFLLESGII